MGRKKGFGVVQCIDCGRFLQEDPEYYVVVKRTLRVGFRARRHKTIGHLCVLCYGKKGKLHMVKNVTIYKILKAIKTELSKIGKRLDFLELPRAIDVKPENLNALLLSIPDHLRRSYMVMLEQKEGSAGEIAKITKRKRAAESLVLNTLVQMGLLKKRKKGMFTVFYV